MISLINLMDNGKINNQFNSSHLTSYIIYLYNYIFLGFTSKFKNFSI